MFSDFSPRHLPALFIGTTLIMGGPWSLFAPRSSLREFGFSPRTVASREAQAVMAVGSNRGAVLGVLVWLFYAQGKLAEVDLILALTGFYLGVVDSWIVYSREDKTGTAVFRLVSSWLIGLWGWNGMVKGV